MPSKKHDVTPFFYLIRQACKARKIEIGDERGQLPGKIYHLFQVGGLRVEFGHAGNRPVDNSPRHVFFRVHNDPGEIINLCHNGGARMTVRVQEARFGAFRTLKGSIDHDKGTVRIHSSSAKSPLWIDAVNAALDAILEGRPSRT